VKDAIFLTILALLVSACQVVSGAHRPAATAPPYIGRVLTYQRSNLDGSEAETIRVFRRSASRIEVVKTRAPCSSAAFVSAELDPVLGDATHLAGGRLLPGGRHTEEAWLDLNSDGTRLELRLGSHTSSPVQSITVQSRPWHLYDFDFATLASTPPDQLRNGHDLRFGLALSLVRPAGLDLQWLGAIQAHFTGREVIAGRSVNKYRISGTALTPQQDGWFWTDADDGTLVRATLGLPNHVEYRDFHLNLLDVARGEAAWERALLSHFADCPGV